MRRLSYLKIAIVAGGMPLATSAQGAPGRQIVAADCAAPLRELTAGKSPATTFSLLACDAALPAALTQALQNNATNADTTFWNTMYTLVSNVRDEPLFAASLNVLLNNRASTEARFVGLSNVLTTAKPGSFISPDYRKRPTGRGVGLSCVASNSHSSANISGPVSNASSRTAAALDSVAANPQSPAMLAEYAQCARRYITDVPIVPRNLKLSAAYVCGNDYRIRVEGNESAVPLTLAVKGESKPRSVPSMSRKEFRISLDSARPFEASYGTGAIVRASHGAKSCIAERYRARGMPIPPSVDTLENPSRRFKD